MSHVVSCPKCQQHYQLNSDPSGKSLKCPACQTVFQAGAQPAAPSAPKRKQQPKQVQKSKAQQSEYASVGVAGPLQAQPQLFPDQQTTVPGGADPLANHVIQDPGFAAVDIEEIRIRREQEAQQKSAQLEKSFGTSSSLAQLEDEEDHKKRMKKSGYLSHESLFGFEGRFSRKQFWLTSLLVGLLETGLLIGVVAVFATITILLEIKPENAGLILTIPFFGIFGFVGIINTWISLAIHVKRFHDRNKTWVWILISFIPFIGPIWMFIECGFLRGTIGKNQFGPDPVTAARA